MNSITISMDPRITELFGRYPLEWHGIMVVLGLLGGLALTLYLAKKTGLAVQLAREDAISKGQNPDKVGNGIEILAGPIIAAMIGGIVFSRVFHVVDQWEIYSGDIKAIFSIWQGSSIVGVVVGAAIGGMIYARIAGWSWTKLGRIADIAAPGSILGMAIGRIGCFINGDAWGTATGLPWGLMYTHSNRQIQESASYVGHPTPVYEFIWDMLVLAVLLVFRKKLRPAGVSYMLYLSMYSLGRFMITFLRVNDPYLGSLKQAQVATLVIMLVCVPILIYLVMHKEQHKDYK